MRRRDSTDTPGTPLSHRWSTSVTGVLQHCRWVRDDGSLGSNLPVQPGWSTF